VIPIGGADRVSYGQIMQEYARQRGLKRTMIPVPVLTPCLSSLWLGLVTPLYARVGRKLVDSRIVDLRTIRVAASCSRAFAQIRRIGGETGYCYGSRLWRVRGLPDLLVGGVGVQHGIGVASVRALFISRPSAHSATSPEPRGIRGCR